MPNRNLGLLLLAGTLLLCACGREERKEYENEGEVCLSTDGDTLQVEVTFEACLSSSCYEDFDASCEMALKDDTITLSSRGSVVSNNNEVCTADCVPLVARCSLTALADGQYELVHGNQDTTIMIPDASGCYF